MSFPWPPSSPVSAFRAIVTVLGWGESALGIVNTTPGRWFLTFSPVYEGRKMFPGYCHAALVGPVPFWDLFLVLPS